MMCVRVCIGDLLIMVGPSSMEPSDENHWKLPDDDDAHDENWPLILSEDSCEIYTPENRRHFNEEDHSTAEEPLVLPTTFRGEVDHATISPEASFLSDEYLFSNIDEFQVGNENSEDNSRCLFSSLPSLNPRLSPSKKHDVDQERQHENLTGTGELEWTEDLRVYDSSLAHVERREDEDDKKTCGKFVQSSLESFVGYKKPRKASQFRPVQQSILSYIPNAEPKRKASETREKEDQIKSQEKGGRGNWKRRKWGQKEVDDLQPCPFYKKIPGTCFTVDAFKYGEVPGHKAYFLTHFHSDHYGGLNKWWSHGPIFCTAVTARLVNMSLGVDWRWLKPVRMGCPIRVLGVQVTFLPANHCPGSALILFQLSSGKNILHTGDFRASAEMQSYPHLQGVAVDTVYLDTTYCNPRYCFPLQADVSRFAIALSQRQMKENPKTLIVVGSYNVGKERIFLAMAEALKMNIFVERRRMRMLSCLDWPELTSKLTLDASSTSLHVLPLGAMHPPKLKRYLEQFKGKWRAVLGIKPTGWTYSEKIGSHLERITPQVSGEVTVYGLPYSEHSSFTELRDFVQFLKPRQIIPTVNIGRAAEREMMQRHFKDWMKPV